MFKDPERDEKEQKYLLFGANREHTSEIITEERRLNTRLLLSGWIIDFILSKTKPGRGNEVDMAKGKNKAWIVD